MIMMKLSMLLLCATQSRADVLTSTLEQPLRESAHQVSVELHDGYARIVDRRAFKGDGPKPDQLELTINVPEGAVANGLSILANGKWYPGELLESEEAARKYRRLTGLGLAKLKDPAILYWLNHDALGLQVFPVIAGQETWVETTMVMPLHFDSGSFSLDLPLQPMQKSDDEPTHLAPIDVRVTQVDDVYLNNTLKLNGRPLIIGPAFTRVPAMADDADANIRVVMAPFELRGRMARVELASDREAMRLDIEVGKLSGNVIDARVVLVIDASHSVGVIGLARQVASARAVVALMPTARFEVVTFARKQLRHTTGFVTASKADVVLQSLRDTKLKNGSEVPAAVAFAASLLSSEQTQHTRILVFSDGHVRGTSHPSELTAAMNKQRAVLLLGQVPRGKEGDTPPPLAPRPDQLKRDDVSRVVEMRDDLWMPAVQGHGGIVVAIDSGLWSGPRFRKELEHLVRPTRLSEAHIVRAPSQSHRDRMTDEDAKGALSLPDLHEGKQLMLSAGHDMHELTPVIAGKLWSKEVSFTMTTTPDHQPIAAALMIGDPDSFWTPFEMLRLATVAHAVSPVTSLLAAEPGTRPSIEGLSGLGASGSGGGGSGMGTSTRRGTSTMVLSSWDGVLDAERRACLKQHPPAPTTSSNQYFFVLQRAYQELVDVQPIQAPDTTMAPLQACFLEALWDHTLTGKEPVEDIIALSSKL